MKIAIVGCGGMGHVHAEAYHQMPDVSVTAVCDIIIERAEDMATMTGATAYSSYEQMLLEAEFDVISVTVPSYLHKEMTLKAAAAGKHVISEKPIALSLADTEAMIYACEQNSVRLFVGHVVRFFPEYVQMKQAVEQGKLGDLGVIHTKRSGTHPGDVSAWFRDEDKSGGVIVDLILHDIDYLRWTVGEVTRVYAMGYQTDELEFAYVTLHFANGAVANLEGCWGYPGSFHTSIELAGSKGVIRNNNAKCSPISILQSSNEERKGKQAGVFVEVPQSSSLNNPYELELAHFLECIRTGKQAIVTAHDAYKALEIALAATESLRTGKAVTIGHVASVEGGSVV